MYKYMEQKQHEEMKRELELFREAFKELLEHSKERDIKVDQMYEIFNNGKFLTNVIKWVFGIVIAFGAFYLMIKDIIHAQNN